MIKELFKWYAKCDSNCLNVDGILELSFITETNDIPNINCGPCGNKPLTNIIFIETYTIDEEI